MFAPETTPTETAGLVRGLGPLQAMAVVVSTIIGTGVFLVAAPMARATGSASLVLATWLVGTVVALCGILCFAELGAAFPLAGGLYVYLNRGLGSVYGFLFTLTLAQPFAAAIVLAVTALNCLGGEIRDPQRHFARALIIGAFVVGALYVLANLTYFHVLAFDSVASSQHVATDVVQTIFGPKGAIWLTVAMCISALASLHAVTMAESRAPYAMARRGRFFELTARVHTKFRSPVGALLFVGCVSALVALTGTFEQLYSLYVFSMWGFFALAAVALMRLRAREPNLVRPYRAWGYPCTPLLFGGAAFALTANLLLEQPVRSSVGLLVILSGLPFYRAWRGRKHAS